MTTNAIWRFPTLRQSYLKRSKGSVSKKWHREENHMNIFLSWTGISLDELPWKLLPSEQLFEAFRQKMYTVHCWKTTKIETFSSLQKRIYSIAVSSLRFAGFGSLLVGIEWHHNSHSWAVIVWCVVSNGSMVTPTRTPHQNMGFPVDCPLNQLWDPMNQKRTVSLSFH